MIVGLGNDVVNIERIENLLLRFGERFLNRTFSEVEKNNIISKKTLREQACKAAKFFAVKEATAKALGTGFRDGVFLKKIMVCHDNLGKPYVEFSHEILPKIKTLTGSDSYKFHLSISDDYPVAEAVVIIEI